MPPAARGTFLKNRPPGPPKKLFIMRTDDSKLGKLHGLAKQKFLGVRDPGTLFSKRVLAAGGKTFYYTLFTPAVNDGHQGFIIATHIDR